MVGLSLGLTACSLGALGLRLEHDVSLIAVVRYFTRPHLEQGDLTRWLRPREAGLELETLLDSTDASVFGGLVYADRSRLVFHPRADAALGRSWRWEWENRAVYARLVPLYHRAAAAELIAALSSPEIRSALRARGIDPSGIAGLAADLEGVESEEDETRLRRRAARFIQPFTPNPLSPSWLDFGDSLRFYETAAPAGEFVGQFAVLDPSWGASFDEEQARALSRRSHYILVTRVGERILLLDFYRGEARRYDLRPFDHLTGSRLYHLTVAG